MNDLNFTTLKNDPELSLREDERAQMRAQLIERMRLPARPIPSPFFVFMFQPMPVMALALILIVSLGGVSFAAEGALPGDTLYPVKVSVNERVETYLAPGTEGKAKVAVRHAEERLRETELLAARGTLDDAVADSAADTVRAHVAEAEDAAQTLREEGKDEAADDIRARVAAALSTHAEILGAQADDREEGTEGALHRLSLAVRASIDDAAREDEGETDDARLYAVATAKQARANARLSELSKKLADDGLAEETETTLSDELADLQASFAAAADLMAAEDYPNAIRAYAEIEQRSYRTLALLESAKRIADKTDKEVLIRFGHPAEAPAARPALAAKQAATLSLMAATTSEDASTTQEAEIEDEEDHPSILEFRVRSRDSDED